MTNQDKIKKYTKINMVFIIVFGLISMLILVFKIFNGHSSNANPGISFIILLIIIVTLMKGLNVKQYIINILLFLFSIVFSLYMFIMLQYIFGFDRIFLIIVFGLMILYLFILFVRTLIIGVKLKKEMLVNNENKSSYKKIISILLVCLYIFIFNVAKHKALHIRDCCQSCSMGSIICSAVCVECDLYSIEWMYKLFGWGKN